VSERGEEAEETQAQRVHRELIELLQELRVALPGVQVLFAFLLTVPFANGFDRLTSSDRKVYFAAVVLAAIATALLIAPTAHHRSTFRRGVDVKERILKAANVLTLAGTFALALAMGASVYVITNVLYAASFAAVVAGALTVATVLLWYLVPRMLDERS
jgi:fucose 4-O-acetylase-like acetyltransferase